MFAELELALVLFTTLSQLAVGMALLYGLFAIGSPVAATRLARPRWFDAVGLHWLPVVGIQWLVAAAILALALLASLAHVSYPFEAPRTIVALSTSWLSREVLVFGLLVALMGVTALLGADRRLVLASAALALVALYVQSKVYSPPSYPAIGNGLTFAIFLVTAVTLGAGGAAWFAPAGSQPLLRAILIGSLCAALLLFLAAPSMWSSGDWIMRETAAAYFASPFYWAHIVIGLALPLVVVIALRRIPSWLPLVLLAGALCGRIVFCVDTVHSASAIGSF
jgi:DMSO reductase anchor subunit